MSYRDTLPPMLDSKTAFERVLNERGFPATVKKPTHLRCVYGSWLRRVDLKQFNSEYIKWRQTL